MANTDFSHITNGILQIINTEEGFLKSLDQQTISTRYNVQNRSVRQILGHLIDSASNNHQRMVRLQYNEALTFPDYQQDNNLWIALQDYQNVDWNNLVQLWKFYNLHIIHIIKTVDITKLNNYWYNFENTKVTLQDMIEGYLAHLSLHINEIHELCGSGIN